MYIVIETWPDIESAMIVMNQETGVNKIFKTPIEAEEEKENCQKGIIVKIS